MFAAIPDKPIGALSLWQPWASLLALWRIAKAIETRGYYTEYRGLLAIHSSKGDDELRRFLAAATLPYAQQSPFVRHVLAVMEQVYPGRDLVELFPLGSVLAIGKLVRVQRTETLRDVISPVERAFGNYDNKRWGWVFDEVQMLETPIPARGALMIWEWDPHAVQQPAQRHQRAVKEPVVREAKPKPNKITLPEDGRQLRLF
jgi:activating signal cointegrator 1